MALEHEDRKPHQPTDEENAQAEDTMFSDQKESSDERVIELRNIKAAEKLADVLLGKEKMKAEDVIRYLKSRETVQLSAKIMNTLHVGPFFHFFVEWMKKQQWPIRDHKRGVDIEQDYIFGGVDSALSVISPMDRVDESFLNLDLDIDKDTQGKGMIKEPF